MSSARNFGAFHQVMPTTTMVMRPPNTTAGTVPINLAVKPLSKAPISLEEVMKMELTEETRPLR